MGVRPRREDLDCPRADLQTGWDHTVLSTIDASVQLPSGFSTLVFDADGRLVTVVARPSGPELVAALDVVDSEVLPPLPTPMP